MREIGVVEFFGSGNAVHLCDIASRELFDPVAMLAWHVLLAEGRIILPDGNGRGQLLRFLNLPQLC